MWNLKKQNEWEEFWDREQQSGRENKPWTKFLQNWLKNCENSWNEHGVQSCQCQCQWKVSPNQQSDHYNLSNGSTKVNLLNLIEAVLSFSSNKCHHRHYLYQHHYHYHYPGCHNLRLVLIGKFSQNFVLCDIRDKNAVNQGFWSKTAVFSLPATKVHCLLIFWLPHLYNLLQPGIRKQHKYTSIHWGLRSEDRGLRIEDWEVRTEDWGLRTEDWGLRIED